MSRIPVEVPTGAIRYNTDSNKMECFDGQKWWEISVSNSDLNGGSRGFWAGAGSYSAPAWNYSNVINMVTISTAGDATDFADLTQGVREVGGSSASRTRAIRAGGTISGSNTDTIDYFTMALQANAIDFGNLTANRWNFGASVTGSQTRGVMSFGKDASGDSDVMEYVTIASTGNAVDFGNLITARHTGQGASSPTRTLFWGGFNSGTRLANIDFVNTATTGNALDFGDQSQAQARGGCTGNSVRCLYGGGEDESSTTTRVQTVMFATTGDATDFGDIVSKNVEYASACSSPTRGVWGGGSPGTNNVISYRTIATLGEGVDFGDLVNGGQSRGAMSNGHGGL